MIVAAHLDIGWNAISAGRGFLGAPASGYLVSRASLVGAGVGLVFATLYTAPARASRSMRTRFVYENAHEANLMATAQVNYYRSCELQLIRDLSHMADQAVADAFSMWRGPIMASHSNARAIVRGDRQLTDESVAEIARRGGVVGVSFYSHHLRSSGRATLNDVVKHLVHHAHAAGGPEHVGLGTDLDGGFDARYAPIDSLAKLKELPARLRLHFNRSQVEGIMGNNWLDFLNKSLPR